ncbi:peptidase [bacterium]|nr:MAG: peptidase [bacterium]
MSYCLGIKTAAGLVMGSDSRTSAGDQVSVCQKMYLFVKPGERVFVLVTSGSLSLSQSVVTLLEKDFEAGQGLAAVPTLYDAARVVGDTIRRVAKIDRKYLERDRFNFNVHFIMGGQIKGAEHDLYLIYPQGNPLRASTDAPFLQIGETKYGRPILDRGIKYDSTPLEVAAKYALISLDSTMRSNMTVGPPVDMLLYKADSLKVTQHRRLVASDPDLKEIHTRWEQSLRRAVSELPPVQFEEVENEIED